MCNRFFFFFLIRALSTVDRFLSLSRFVFFPASFFPSGALTLVMGSVRRGGGLLQMLLPPRRPAGFSLSDVTLAGRGPRAPSFMNSTFVVKHHARTFRCASVPHLTLHRIGAAITTPLSRPAPFSSSRRLFSLNRPLDAGIDEEFKSAQNRLGTLTEDPGNMVKLQIYALFKQV